MAAVVKAIEAAAQGILKKKAESSLSQRDPEHETPEPPS